MKFQLSAFGVRGELLELAGVGGVNFGGHDHHLFVIERVFVGGVAEAGQLVIDGLEVGNGVGAAGGVGDIDEMDEQAGALDVAEELDAEA